MVRLPVIHAILFQFALLWLKAASAAVQQDFSPFRQNLPNCNEPFKRIAKTSNAKAILCPMIK